MRWDVAHRRRFFTGDAFLKNRGVILRPLLHCIYKILSAPISLIYGVGKLYLKDKGDFLMEKNITNSKSYRLALIAIMIAMTLIINRVIPATPIYHLSVDFIPVFIAAVFFGPVWSAVTYAAADAIGAVLFPVGPFNPGITFTLFLLGAALGLIYYKKELGGKWAWIRALMAAATAFVIKLFGTTYFLFLTYGGPEGAGYWAYVVSRIPNCIIFAALMFLLLPVIQKIVIQRLKDHTTMY